MKTRLLKIVLLLWGSSLVTAFALAGCIPVLGRHAKETQMALDIQATVIAWQSSQGLQVTLLAQQIELLEQATTIARQAAQLAELSTTLTAVPLQPQVSLVAPGAGNSTGTPTPRDITPNASFPNAPTVTPQATFTPQPTFTSVPDINSFLPEAKILVFESMAGNTGSTRYVKQALDELHLSYVDVADGQGRFKKELLTPEVGDKGWDLIISADETRTGNGIRGEFYTYLHQALKQGSAVIIETWRLDELWGGTIDPILKECGVAYQGDLWELEPGNQVLTNLVLANPILNIPNKSINLKTVQGYWKSGDLGDWLQKTPLSQAVFLLGTRPGETGKYGTSVNCMQGRLILQTFSTHQYDQTQMVHLWQNYIYHALQARLQVQ